MNLLNEDNIVHIWLNIIGDIVVANLLFLLCSIPLVTIGPSLTALYHCMLRTVKGNNNETVKTFFRAWKENFIPSMAIWLILLGMCAVLFLNIGFLNQQGSFFGTILLYASGALMVLLVLVFLYVFPVIAAFSGTVKNHVKNAFLFAFMHFPSTIVIALVSFLPMYMTYRDLQLMPLYAACWFFFGFGLTAFLNSLLFYRMFRPYLDDEEEKEENTQS